MRARAAAPAQSKRFLAPARAAQRYYLPLFASPAPMAKALIIAEKPSVAADIARALGGFTRQGDYFESDDYVLSSAVGHLLELAHARRNRRSSAASGPSPTCR